VLTDDPAVGRGMATGAFGAIDEDRGLYGVPA
jgi:hypothetical protein